MIISYHIQILKCCSGTATKLTRMASLHLGGSTSQGELKAAGQVLHCSHRRREAWRAEREPNHHCRATNERSDFEGCAVVIGEGWFFSLRPRCLNVRGAKNFPRPIAIRTSAGGFDPFVPKQSYPIVRMTSPTTSPTTSWKKLKFWKLP